MNLTSLGYKSDLIFTSFDGQVDDRGDYLVVRTLTNPNYFWGNLLIFAKPPEKGDFAKWREIFQREFPDPRIYHMTFAWDSETGPGDSLEFIEGGFDLQEQAVMSATSVNRPPKFNEALQVRCLQADQDWKDMTELQIVSGDDKLPREEIEKFYLSQVQRYRRMESAGMGHWYGGFLQGRLVAALGIYHREGLGRFQSVVTHPEFRRQGLCGTLVYRSALMAFAEMKADASGARELVMCADPGYHALGIYESVGFKTRQREFGVSWWDRRAKGAPKL